MQVVPARGVIIVEYYWQRPIRPLANVDGLPESGLGHKSSCVFFKPWKISGRCWCGSAQTFGKCHRRKDDWTYITYNPDLAAHSAVTLLDWSAEFYDLAQGQAILKADKRLLPLEHRAERSSWALPFEPAVSNGAGELILGAITVTPGQIHIETNSEPRLAYIHSHLQNILNDSIPEGRIRRVEPQTAFPSPSRREPKRSKR
jgi:hypothetical protein